MAFKAHSECEMLCSHLFAALLPPSGHLCMIHFGITALKHTALPQRLARIQECINIALIVVFFFKSNKTLILSVPIKADGNLRFHLSLSDYIRQINLQNEPVHY